MPDYRRYFVAGGTYFFTLVTYGRARFLCSPLARSILRGAMSRCQERWPFEIPAIVLLPDHLHAIWSLPRGDAAYPRRWGWIKKEFTKECLSAGFAERMTTAGLRRQRRSGVWQRRYWEHTIDDERDFDRHFDYIHYNAVKHGLVQSPKDWEFSSFHRWVEHGVYPPEWGAAVHGPLDFSDLNETAME